MAWQGIEGHDDVVERLRRSLSRERLPSTFLFVGPRGIGKHTFALKFAQALLCQRRPEAELDPCGQCDSCVQVAARSHPDLDLIAKPADKSFIPLSSFIGDDTHRLRQGLCHRISLRPFLGGRKVALIDDTDDLNEEGANALLKLLEEPPPCSVLILLGTSADKQLPTIRSRAQIVRFRPLEPAVVARLLMEQKIVSDPAEADRLAAYSEGSFQRAVELADSELWNFRNDLLSRLARPRFDSLPLAKALTSFVDEAGKEASARRDRSRQVIDFVVEFYRQLLRAHAGLAPAGDEELIRAVGHALPHAADEETIVAQLERCLEAHGHIDRNANQATLLECWVADLARLQSPAKARS